jgi:SAM-dependent methyltransferase
MSYLETRQKTWDKIAEEDAFWAILSDPKRRGNKWEPSEFFGTGTREVKTVLDYLQSLGVPTDYDGAALDFGCGAGRLTQALAARFSRAVGVDISAKMVALAEKHNRFPNSCQYISNGSNSLPLPDGTFSFVYSSIALQHIEPRFVESYIAEFMRVLKPGGVLVFQVADRCKGRYFYQFARAIRGPIRRVLGDSRLTGSSHAQVFFLGEKRVRAVLGDRQAEIREIEFTNSLAADFNGDLRYLGTEPETGLVSKQYCVVKKHSEHTA